MEEHLVTFSKTGRYYTSGPLTASYRNVFFVLHGYGQLASYFIRKFGYAELKDTLFVAPEGMHRFYLKDSKGRVGASWMTREARLDDINDYCAYLDQTFEEIHKKVQPWPGKTGLLGFSQGVATACRWLAHSSISFSCLISWAGAFPPDLDFETAIPKMNRIPVHMVLGTEDEFITEEDFAQHLAFLRDRGTLLQVSRFQGKHTIPREPLLRVLRAVAMN